MATATDPYYWSRDVMNFENQQRAVGRSGMTPGALSEVIRANFEAQQEHELSQERINLAKEQQANVEIQQAEQKGQASSAARSQLYSSGAQLAISTPLLYGTAKSAGLIGGTTTTAGTSGVAVTGATEATGAAAGTSTGQAAVTGSTAGSTGLGTAALGAVEVAGASYLGYEAGSHLIHGKHSKQAGVAGATATGAAIGSIVPGIGTVIGAAIGFVVGEIMRGSIICTELNRQGYISDSMLRASTAYVKKYGDKEGYIGYLIFASPIVEEMKKSKLVTLLALPYGKVMCRECASRIMPNKYESTWFSRLVYKVSEKIFIKIFRNKIASLSQEVING